MKKIFKLFLIVSLFSLAIQVSAATDCKFTRDLNTETSGEDVRCLQKFLNSSGYKIADSGVGSPGNETTLFKGLTEKAVIKWQMDNGLIPATGNWGPGSRAKYSKLIIGTSTVATSTISTTTTSTDLSTNSSEKQKAENLLKKAVDKLEQAEKKIDDGEGDTISAKNSLKLAREDFLNASRSYFLSEYADSLELAQSSYDNSTKVLSQNGDKDYANKAISDAKKAISRATSKISDADDNGDDISKAEILLNKSKNALNNSQKYLTDKNYTKARDYGNKAEDYANEAVDAL